VRRDLCGKDIASGFMISVACKWAICCGKIIGSREHARVGKNFGGLLMAINLFVF